nr:hypothetical protein [Tanacetum cinerariifolium]
MSWAELMKLMTEVYYPRNETQKMETELWNLTVKGNDLTAYTRRFQELVLLCTRMVPNEEEKVKRFVGDKVGEQPERQSWAAISFQAENVRGQNVATAYTIRNNNKKEYVGSLPYCNKCKLHHAGLCTVRCGNCKRVSHMTRDCKVTVTPNTQRSLVGNQLGPVWGCDILVSRAKVIENQVMAISVISVSSDSFEDSVRTPAGRIDTTVIPTETPVIAPTMPPSPDYTPASPDYSPASEIESGPSKDPSSGHIPPLPVVSPFLSSDDDTTNSYTPDTPPSPTHSLRHSLSDHSSPDLPSTSMGTSRKRRRFPMTSVALPPVSGALSPVRADLIPSPKGVRDIFYLADVEVGLRETRVERVTHPAMPEDIPEPTQEGVVEVIEGVQREQGHRIIGVKLAITALTERVAELERDNRRLRDTTIVESQRVDRLQRGMSCENEGNENEGNGEMEMEIMEEMRMEETEEIEMEIIKEMRMEGMKKMEIEGMEKWESWHELRRTIGVHAAYAIKWAGLIKLITEELILLCTRMVPDEEDRVERFIGWLPDNIQGNVIAVNPARL